MSDILFLISDISTSPLFLRGDLGCLMSVSCSISDIRFLTPTCLLAGLISVFVLPTKHQFLDRNLLTAIVEHDEVHTRLH